jgi:hypothetical protein
MVAFIATKRIVWFLTFVTCSSICSTKLFELYYLQCTWNEYILTFKEFCHFLVTNFDLFF